MHLFGCESPWCQDFEKPKLENVPGALGWFWIRAKFAFSVVKCDLETDTSRRGILGHLDSAAELSYEIVLLYMRLHVHIFTLQRTSHIDITFAIDYVFLGRICKIHWTNKAVAGSNVVAHYLQWTWEALWFQEIMAKKGGMFGVAGLKAHFDLFMY